MNCEEMVSMHISLAVNAILMEPDRPGREQMTAGSASDYIRELLERSLSRFGLVFSVRPLAYPKCSKIPIIISMRRLGTRLFWFHPDAEAGTIVKEIEGTLCDLIERAISVPVQEV